MKTLIALAIAASLISCSTTASLRNSAASKVKIDNSTNVEQYKADSNDCILKAEIEAQYTFGEMMYLSTIVGMIDYGSSPYHAKRFNKSYAGCMEGKGYEVGK